MKVYSDTLTQADLFDTLPKGVDFLVLDLISRPRKRRNGWTVHLTGSSPYASSQGGFGGSPRPKAATWDEHGEWMAELFRRDPLAVIGMYRNAEHFIEWTRKERDRIRTYFSRDDKYARTHRAPWLTEAGTLAP